MGATLDELITRMLDALDLAELERELEHSFRSLVTWNRGKAELTTMQEGV